MTTELKRLLHKLKDNGVRLDVQGEDLNIKVAKGGMSKELLSEIKDSKMDLITYFKGAEKQASHIPQLPEQPGYMISDAQRRLWVLSQFEAGSVAYNMPSYIDLMGAQDVGSFKKAVNAVIARFEILRTVFKEDENGEVRQWVTPAEDFEFSIDYKDYRQESGAQELVAAYIEQDTYDEFDLEKGPLLHAALLQVSEEHLVFYFNMHHIISDGWSQEILSRELFTFYEGFRNNTSPQLPALTIQYKEYAAWQRAQLRTEGYEAHRQFWLKQLGGELPILDLPSKKLRPRIMTHQGHTLSTYLSPSSSKGLKQFCREQGGSLFMGLLTTWKILLARYTAENDIVIGTPVAGREQADLESQIGFFVNTLALRNSIDSALSFEELFAKIKSTTLAAFKHQAYPFDRLVEELKLERNTARSAVFDVMLTLQNIGENSSSTKQLEGQEQGIEDQGRSLSKFDLDITFKEEGDVLYFDVNYNADVYEKELIDQLMRHYRQLINQLLKKPLVPIGQIDYLSETEREQLLTVFNQPHIVKAVEKNIVELFQEQVKRVPNDIAVVFRERSMTYAELDQCSTVLAVYLQEEYQIQGEELVSIELRRSEWLIITILGILKAGAAYVPIDPNYPAERIAYLQKDSNCQLNIDEKELDKFIQNQQEYENGKLVNEILPEQLAYVIYTSGTTGQPKGVMVEHRNVASIHADWKLQYGLNEFAIHLLQMASVSFDVFVGDICRSLLIGGRMIICEDDLKLNPEGLYALMQQHAISIFEGTPGVVLPLMQYVEEQALNYDFLKIVILGSDSFSNPEFLHLKNIFGNQLRIINSYGVTEATIDSTFYEKTDPSLLGTTPIGKPFAHSNIYLLDKNRKLVPPGVFGELYIGGAGVSRGYHERPELTTERFIDSPFSDDRLYFTGDQGRWLPDGNIEFSGRKDDQVKIRGYRIELGEVVHALLTQDEIASAVVLCKTNEEGQKNLTAYLVASQELQILNLRKQLKAQLPDYMIPAYFVQVEAMPLTTNGKVDRKALLKLNAAGISTGVDYVAPRTEQEKLVVAVWTQVLKRENIGIKDSFYSLGGDSIKSIQVVSRIKQQGFSLKVEDILRNPVLEDLASFVRAGARAIDQSSVSGIVALTPVQISFFTDPAIPNKAHYNQSVVLSAEESIDIAALEKVLGQLCRHHDALRMTYQNQSNGHWQQINREAGSKAYSFYSYDWRTEEDALAKIKARGEQLQSAFNIDFGPIFQVAHFRTSKKDYLALIIHHLVVDGVSWRILLEDLNTLYNQYKNGEKGVLPLKTDSFLHWANQQKEVAQSDMMEQESEYWKKMSQLKIPSLVPELHDHTAAFQLKKNSSFTLDRATTELLQTKVHRALNTEINDILLTALALGLKDTFGCTQSTLLMEGHGREEIIEDIDISRTVGWFTTVFPFVLAVETEDSIENLIHVKEALRAIPNKGIGYGMIKYLGHGFEQAIKPTIAFNYLGDFGNNAGADEAGAFGFTALDIGPDVSPENGEAVPLSVNGMQVGDQLSMTIHYADSIFSDEKIQTLVNAYEGHLKQLIETLSTTSIARLTPADLDFRGLSITELNEINSDYTVENIYSLSPMQEGMYYHWLSDADSPMYFEQVAYRAEAPELPIDLLKDAYDQLIDRHSILRTAFSNEYADQPLQIVRHSVPSSFQFIDLSNINDKQAQLAELKIIKENDLKNGFDLAGPSQMRVQIVKMGNGGYEFIWSHHHILMDGWCVSIMINDFYELFNALREQRPSRLSKALPYVNYINWLNQQGKQGSIKYWQQYLANYSATATLPYAQTNTAEAYQPAETGFKVEKQTYANIIKHCNQIGITQNTFIQGVWGFLLAQYNNAEEAIFGAVVSGRPVELAGVEDMIGLFINTIPVRIQYSDEDSVATYLQRLQQEAIAGNDHHYLSLSEILAEAGGHQDFVNHIMVFENYPIQEAIAGGAQENATKKKEAFKIEGVEIHEQTNYDLNIVIAPFPDAIGIEFKFNQHKYKKGDVERIAGHLQKLINQFSADVEERLVEMDYLTLAERDEILNTFNNTHFVYEEQTVTQLFEQQVEKTPNAIALLFEEEMLTYAEVNKRSNQLAAYLREECQVKKGQHVGVMLKRSSESVIAMIAIMKAGACYVPIDYKYPKSRLDFIAQDADLQALLCDSSLAAISNNLAVRVIANLDQLNLEKFATENLANINQLADSSYVIYTSGSTGKPKGVIQTHRMMTNLINWDIQDAGIETGLRLMQYGSFSFDVSLHDIFFKFCSGGSIYLVSEEECLDYNSLLKSIVNYKIEVLSFPFTALSNFFNENDLADFAGHSIQHIISCAEQLYVGGPLLDFLNEYPQVFLHNQYGPSETHVVTAGRMQMAAGDVVERASIGKPVFNTDIYILDKYKKPVAQGILGEIYVGGDNLAIGYLHRPDLTAEKFIPDVIKPGRLMYTVGDIGKWLPDGNIVYIGRNDNQVKVRGYRIELGEIQTVLQKKAGIDQVEILVYEAQKGEKELVAYYVAQEEQRISEMQTYLQANLPAYMMPSYFVAMDKFPLTPNGKVDKRALPAPQLTGLKGSAGFLAPRNSLEKEMAEIWARVLGQERIGVRDNFFELGGHSLKVLRLANAYRKAFSCQIKLQNLFEHNTIEAQYALIKSAQPQVYDTIAPIATADDYPLSDAQRRLWVLSQFSGGSAAYNMSASLPLDKEYDIEQFQNAIWAVIDRHEILRTIFIENKQGDVRQMIKNRKELDFDFDQLDFSTHSNPRQAANTYIAKQSKKVFDLSTGPLLEFSLLQLAPAEFIFYYNLHHIICDGWSLEVLGNEIMRLYEIFTSTKPALPAPLTIQYKDYSAWQLAQLTKAGFDQHRNFWKTTLAGELPRLDLPGAANRPELKSYKGASLLTYIEPKTCEKLQDYVQQQGGSLFMGLLASWNVMFNKFTIQEDIILGTPVAGRVQAELEEQIGFYVNTLALRNQIDSENNFTEFYQQVIANTLKAFDHQLYPFDRLVEELDTVRDTSRNAIFDVLLVFQNNGEKKHTEKITREEYSTIVALDSTTSKYDLILIFEEVGDGISFVIEYDTSIYNDVIVRRLMKYYKKLLAALLENPTVQLKAVNYFSASEVVQHHTKQREQIIPMQTVVEFFAEQAVRSPAALAVEFGEQRINYQELATRVNALADYLIDEKKQGRGDRIGVMLERSVESVVAMIAVMKTGACYVPLDYNYPSARIHYIIQDANINLILTEPHCLSALEIEEEITLNIHELELPNSQRETWPAIDLAEESFMVYTSGSTGNPKGVIQTHLTLSNLIEWDIKRSGIEIGLKYLQYASFSFDASLHDILFVLSCGGSVYIVEEKLRLDFYALEEVILEKNIQVLSLPYSALSNLFSIPDVFKKGAHQISHIVSCAEQLYVGTALWDFLKENPKVKLHNHYGPSETHVVTGLTMSHEQGNIVHRPTLGKPIINTDIYILDEALQPVPVSVPGELYIGGYMLAIGYANLPEETKKRFIPHPFKKDERVYKTGDLGYWDEEGQIEFLGRKDDQVKIRGFRIELGEIEQCLLKHELIKSAIVLCPKNKAGENELVAYVIASEEVEGAELRRFLQQSLATYLLPNHFIQLDEFPLTFNGKVDKKRLPAPQGRGFKAASDYAAPRTPLEKQLVTIWQEVLMQERVGIHDDFFSLGGHSLNALKLLNAYQKELGIKLHIETVFTNRTPAGHAQLLEISDWMTAEKKSEEELITQDKKIINF